MSEEIRITKTGNEIQSRLKEEKTDKYCPVCGEKGLVNRIFDIWDCQSCELSFNII